MRNMAVLHSPAFSYPLPVLVRVLFNLLIFKGKILYYNKYTKKLVPLFHENETFYIVFYLTIRIGTIPLVQTISFPFHLKWMDFFPDS